MQTTRRQHYVRKQYLSAWIVDNHLWVSRGAKVFSTSPENILHERDFYQIEHLNENEWKIVKHFIAMNQLMKALNEGWLSDNQFFTFLLDNLTGRHIPTEIAEHIAIQAGEELQSQIENDAEKQYLALMKGDCSFWQNTDESISFQLYLCQQYFRSKNMRDRMIRIVESAKCQFGMEDVDGGRIWKVLQYVLMTDLAYNIGPLNGFNLVILDNQTGLNFITGDQPIINLCEDLTEIGEPKELVFYYPLSPQMGMILTQKTKQNGRRYAVNIAEADWLNRKIVAEMEFSIIADSEELISRYLLHQ